MKSAVAQRPTSGVGPQPLAQRLRVTEIFLSLQGESRTTGLPTAFIRLTGCPLRCVYCDTAYAFHGGQWMGLDQILEQVAEYQVPLVTVTGGEPLAQPACLDLLTRLCDAGYRVSLETGGAISIDNVDRRVSVVLDLKTPGSGELDRNLYENLEAVSQKDQVKFVICDRADYLWARDQLTQRQIPERCEVLFSPEHAGMDAATLAEWVLADRLPVRVQIQLHKYLWGDVPGR